MVDNETCVLADNKCHVEWPGGNQPQIARNRGGVEDSGDYSGVPEPVNRESVSLLLFLPTAVLAMAGCWMFLVGDWYEYLFRILYVGSSRTS